MNAKHTATPWQTYQNQNTEIYSIYSESSGSPTICDMVCRIGQEANAKHIVHCVNLHDELIEALKWAYDYIELTIKLDGSESVDAESTQLTFDKIKEALAKAKEDKFLGITKLEKE